MIIGERVVSGNVSFIRDQPGLPLRMWIAARATAFIGTQADVSCGGGWLGEDPAS